MIESVAGKREYFVEKSQDKPCTEKKGCRFLCLVCNVCSHIFSCQSTDYLIKVNISKHIHLLSRYIDCKIANCKFRTAKKMTPKSQATFKHSFP